MATTINTPSWLTPIGQLAEGVEVVGVAGEPERKSSGEVKEQPEFFPGCKAWKIRVELVKSRRSVERDGEEVVKENTVPMSVTVWAAKLPVMAPGEFVRFSGILVGAVEGNIYVQATGLEVF